MNLFTFVLQVLLQTCTSSTEVIFSILPSVNPSVFLVPFQSFCLLVFSTPLWTSLVFSSFVTSLFPALSLSLRNTAVADTPFHAFLTVITMNEWFVLFLSPCPYISLSTKPFFHWGSLTMFTLSLLISVCTWLLLCVYAQKVVCLWVS